MPSARHPNFSIPATPTFEPFHGSLPHSHAPLPDLLLQNHSILSIEPRTFSFTFSSFLRKSRPTPAHNHANIFPLGVYRNLSELIRTYQRKSDTFRLVPINSDTLLLTYRPHPTSSCHTTTHLCPLTQARAIPHLRKLVLFFTEWTGGWYDGSGAVVPYNQIVARMPSNRTVQTIRHLPSSAQFSSYYGLVFSHPPLRFLRPNDLSPPSLAPIVWDKWGGGSGGKAGLPRI